MWPDTAPESFLYRLSSMQWQREGRLRTVRRVLAAGVFAWYSARDPTSQHGAAETVWEAKSCVLVQATNRGEARGYESRLRRAISI